MCTLTFPSFYHVLPHGSEAFASVFSGRDPSRDAGGGSRDVCHGDLHRLPREIPGPAAPSEFPSTCSSNALSVAEVWPSCLHQPDVMSGKVPRCPTCRGVVKPDIVFFGEELPHHFLKYLKDFPLADLLVVMGTSLEVRAEEV